jgi:hypothetical protein
MHSKDLRIGLKEQHNLHDDKQNTHNRSDPGKYKLHECIAVICRFQV